MFMWRSKLSRLRVQLAITHMIRTADQNSWCWDVCKPPALTVKPSGNDQNSYIEMVLYSEFSHSEYVIFPSYIGLQEGISFSRQQHHPSDYGPNPTAACAFASGPAHWVGIHMVKWCAFFCGDVTLAFTDPGWNSSALWTCRQCSPKPPTFGSRHHGGMIHR